MKHESHVAARRERGLSTVEILIIMAVVCIMAGFAVFSVVRARENMRLVNAARELQGNLEKARADAVRRHGVASIQVLDARSYVIAIDLNGDGTVDANGNGMIDVADQRVVYLPVGVNFDVNPNQPAAVFDWRGRVPNDMRFVLRGVNGYGQPTHSMPDITLDITAGGDIAVNSDVQEHLPAIDATPFPTPTPNLIMTPTPTPNPSPSPG